MPCVCSDTSSSYFISSVFNTCVANGLEYTSFVFGWLSIFCWIVALWPQIRLNFCLKQTEAISLGFILQWIVGDVCNAASTIIVRLLLTQQFLGLWYCFVDIFMIAELIIYRKPGKFHAVPSKMTAFEIFVYCAIVVIVISNIISYGIPEATLMKKNPTSFKTCKASKQNNKALNIFGNVLSYLTIPLYGLAKPCQIYKNWKTKKVDGLSAGMFICTLSGNVFQFISLMCDIANGSNAVKQIPFIFACTWPAICDSIILCQCHKYSKIVNDKDLKLQETNKQESGNHDQQMSSTVDISVSATVENQSVAL